MMVLGWQLDTRRLLIQLPCEKAETWANELEKCLETSHGRNIHIAMIIPGAMHFHSRMYTAIDRARLSKNKATRLTTVEHDDLLLIRHLISVAQRGISLNNMVRRMPDQHIGRSDAFEGGLGGYNLASGLAWRYRIQPEDKHKSRKKNLEYLTCMTQLICMLEEECAWSLLSNHGQ
jgi:hypothetical protein